VSNQQSADFSPLVSRSAARSAIRDALRLYVGRGRRYSVKQLSNATGVPDRLIECAMADVDSTEYRPLAYECLFSIALFLGSDFTSEWLKLARQAAFDLPDEDLPPGALAADTVDDAAVVTRAALDGEFKPHERPDLRVVGRRMVTRGMRLAAA
jgi:hypothetical protein